ncbi:MAG: hypothetical protein ACRCZY_08050 [Phocaeicola sp.]
MEQYRINAEQKALEKELQLQTEEMMLDRINTIAGIRIPKEEDELIILLSELSTKVKVHKWQRGAQSINNKFSEALLEKLQQCIVMLKSINPSSLHLNYYNNIARKAKYRQFALKYKYLNLLSIILIIVSVAFLSFFFTYFILGFAAVLLVVFFIMRIIKKKCDSALSNTQTTKKAEFNEVINTSDSIPSTTEEVTQSVFFDLNENERIENCLSNIWIKYSKLVSHEIITRKPIFSADGVINSILFVGVNPSYNPSDDNTFVSSDNNKTLLYGSLYQREDAPEYFKKLESFASCLSKGYTHINLLYARENDRELLLKSNHNFIREQLELTYETITKVNPVAIVFFSDYCKSLIFGEDRWVSPSSKVLNHFILKGTKYPVFFTDDITQLSKEEQQNLIKEIKQTI